MEITQSLIVILLVIIIGYLVFQHTGKSEQFNDYRMFAGIPPKSHAHV